MLSAILISVLKQWEHFQVGRMCRSDQVMFNLERQVVGRSYELKLLRSCRQVISLDVTWDLLLDGLRKRSLQQTVSKL